jgi:hypothetical protein
VIGIRNRVNFCETVSGCSSSRYPLRAGRRTDSRTVSVAVGVRVDRFDVGDCDGVWPVTVCRLGRRPGLSTVWSADTTFPGETAWRSSRRFATRTPTSRLFCLPTRVTRGSQAVRFRRGSPSTSRRNHRSGPLQSRVRRLNDVPEHVRLTDQFPVSRRWWLTATTVTRPCVRQYQCRLRRVSPGSGRGRVSDSETLSGA